jgi:hypothetical protein
MKIVLLSSHGDQYYIGMNGFQLYDGVGDLVHLSEDQLQATPYRFTTKPNVLIIVITTI